MKTSSTRTVLAAALVAAALAVPSSALAATPAATAAPTTPTVPAASTAKAPASTAGKAATKAAAKTAATRATGAKASAATTKATSAGAHAPTGAKSSAAATGAAADGSAPPADTMASATDKVTPPVDTSAGDDTSSGSSLLGTRNLLLGALLFAGLGGLLVARRRRADGGSTDAGRDPSAAAQDAAIHAAAQAADAGALAAGIVPAKSGRRSFSLRRKAAAEPELEAAMPLAATSPTFPASTGEPATPAPNVLAMPGHEQWAQPQAQDLAVAAAPAAPQPPSPLTTPATDTATASAAVTDPFATGAATAPAPPAPSPTPTPVAAAPSQQPAPLTFDGVVPPGAEAPGQWVELEHAGNVVFQLTSSEGAPLEILFADAAGTWFQVPPMDPASGAVALPLDAGRYYVQLRDPSQRAASFRLVIWPAAPPVTTAPAQPQAAAPAAFDPTQQAPGGFGEPPQQLAA